MNIAVYKLIDEIGDTAGKTQQKCRKQILGIKSELREAFFSENTDCGYSKPCQRKLTAYGGNSNSWKDGAVGIVNKTVELFPEHTENEEQHHRGYHHYQYQVEVELFFAFGIKFG